MYQRKLTNILMVLTSCWEHQGGIQQVNRSLVRFLAKQSIDTFIVKVLVLVDSQKTVNEALEREGINAPNIKVIGFSRNKRELAITFFKTVLLERPTNVFLGHINFFPLALFLWIWRMPLILWVYGIEVWRPITFLEYLFLQRCSMIISISDHTKRMAAKWHRGFKYASVCHLGIDVYLSKTSFDGIKPSWVDRSSKILCVGRMSAKEDYKGHRELIQAMTMLRTRLPDSILIFVGMGSGVLSLKKMIIDLGLEDGVHFAGFVEDEQLPAYYNACDVFAMPSRGEGFGLVYLEAMAHGKPCVGSTIDAAGEIIVDGETGFLVNPDNIAELADCLFRLLSDSELRVKMGEKGRERYQNIFTEQKFHERLTQILGWQKVFQF